jgi:multidrug resistance efflux pump
MILALMVVYVAALHLVFNVFKWVQPTVRNQIYVTVAGLVGIYGILLLINVYQPMSTDLRVFRYVIPVSASVSGPVVEVPIEENSPLDQGDVLFQIDPVPYRAAVGQLESQLAFARLRAKETRALYKKKAGSRFDMEEFEARAAQLENSLEAARFNLEQTTVRAPTRGRVTDVALRPGQVVRPGGPVMTFVSTETQALAATFRQEVIRRIQIGDTAELAFDTFPGRTFAATVVMVDRDIPQGQVVPSGQVLDTTRAPHGFVFVLFELVDDEDLDLAAGEAGAATVYTDRGQAFVPVRKVFFRWYTWLNFLITDADIRGLRAR